MLFYSQPAEEEKTARFCCCSETKCAANNILRYFIAHIFCSLLLSMRLKFSAARDGKKEVPSETHVTAIIHAGIDCRTHSLIYGGYRSHRLDSCGSINMRSNRAAQCDACDDFELMESKNTHTHRAREKEKRIRRKNNKIAICSPSACTR